MARMPVPILRSLSVGTPPFIVSQAESRAAVQQLFPRMSQRQSMLAVFENAQIDSRAISRPPEWYLEPHGFAEKNAVYVETALHLGERLCREALHKPGSSQTMWTRSCLSAAPASARRVWRAC